MVAVLGEDGLCRVLERAEEERGLLGQASTNHPARPRLLQDSRSPVLYPFLFNFTTGP
jgi:hypothetical protein